MLRSFRKLKDFNVVANDLVLGRLKSSQLALEDWKIWYLIIQGFNKEKIEIPTDVLKKFKYEDQKIYLSLTEDSENRLLEIETMDQKNKSKKHSLVDSMNLLGSKVLVDPRFVGRIQDVIIDDQNWKIKDIIVDLKRWMPCSNIRIPVDWLSLCEDSTELLRVNYEEKTVDQWPMFDPADPINHENGRDYDFFGRLVE